MLIIIVYGIRHAIWTIGHRTYHFFSVLMAAIRDGPPFAHPCTRACLIMRWFSYEVVYEVSNYEISLYLSTDMLRSSIVACLHLATQPQLPINYKYDMDMDK